MTWARVTPARRGGQDQLAQPRAVTIRFVDAGKRASLSFVRAGRGTSAPLQLGHLPLSVPSAHEAQNVHPKEQMRASVADGSRSASQHSQLGRMSSMLQGYSSQGDPQAVHRTKMPRIMTNK